MSAQKPIHFIFAVGENGEFGNVGRLPWPKITGDMKYFTHITTSTSDPETMENMVLMGVKTWESIPSKHRPLKNRLNVVLSTNLQPEGHETLLWERSIQNAIQLFDESSGYESLFVIGGVKLLEEVLRCYPERCSTLYLTCIHGRYSADVFLNIDPFFKVFSATDPATHVTYQDESTQITFTHEVHYNPYFK